MTTQILLKQSPKHKPQEISPRVHLTGKDAYIIFGPVQIGGQARDLAALLRRLADDLEPVIQHTVYDRVLTITPAEVVAYFEQSSILRCMAANARAALLNGAESTNSSAQSQLEADLQQVLEADLNHAASKADISEVLTGQRAWGGETMKKRLDDIQRLLTTAKNGLKRTSPRKKAA